MPDQKSIKVPVQGMHCKSCEMLLEDELKSLKGVTKTEASFQKGEVEIAYEGNQPDLTAVNDVILKMGYKPGAKEEPLAFFSKDRTDYQDLGIAFLILVGIYFILKALGLNNFRIDTSGDSITLSVIFLVGLTAGVSTCMALVGGLILGVFAEYSKKFPDAGAMEKFRPQIFFNIGRLASYAVLGGLLGVLGSVFQLSSGVLGIITILIGLIMLVMGLQLIAIFPWAEKLRFALPKPVAKFLRIRNEPGIYSHKNTFILGALTFFLPCGFTQAMQVFAVSTGTFWGGALVMGTFALGTLPGLLGVGGLTSLVKGNSARRFFKLVGLVIIVFSVFNISNALGLMGIRLASTNAKVNLDDKNVTQADSVQIVKMAETADGYVPNSFTIKKGVPVRWVIDAQDAYSCASSIVLSKMGIRKTLKAGENIIEFTPTDVGQLNFSCSMGMYTGVFNVVDSNGLGVSGITPAVDETGKDGGTCGINAGTTCGK